MEIFIAILLIPAVFKLAEELCDEIDSQEFREDLSVILPDFKR